MSHDTRADKAGKDALSCFIVDMGSRLEIKPSFWKERKKETASKNKSSFAPAVKFLELPKEEER